MAHRIKEVLKEKKITSAQLAEKLNVTPPAVSSILNGSPNLDTISKIALILDCTVTELIEKPHVCCPHCGKPIHFTIDGQRSREQGDFS